MKSTLIFVICMLAIANAKMTLNEIDQTQFGHTLLDTIQLQLQNLDVEDGALTGPVRVIYDMLLELRDELYGEQDDDNNGLDALCLDCTTTIADYTVRVTNLQAQMVLDAGEVGGLENSMGQLQTEASSAQDEVGRLNILLTQLLDSHNSQVAELNELIAEAQGVHDALAQARQIIASGLVSTGAFIQTNAAAAIMAKLKNVKSKMRGYALLGYQFVELATNQEIVSDQSLVQNLLDAFDDLMESCIDDMYELELERTDLVNTYEVSRGALDREKTGAMVVAQNAQNELQSAQGRLSQLQQKQGMDATDLAAWQQFVIDEGIRCTQEEASYNARIEERTEQLRVLEEVIFLFETRFVELNDFINTRVDFDDETVENQ